MITIETSMETQRAALIRQPPPVTILPLLVSGIPIEREIRDLAAEIPKSLFHEKPPRFIFLSQTIQTIFLKNTQFFL
jgi:hypothetical protein